MSIKPEHEVAYRDLLLLLRKHEKDVSAEEMLAIAANVVGKLVAMQNQTTMTAERALEIVDKNMAIGNSQVIRELLDAKPEGKA